MEFKFKKKKEKIKIRQAKFEDIPQIIFVEKEAWGEKGAATKEMLESRIKTFQEGNLVAESDKKIIGVVFTEIVNYDPEKNSYSWYEITDSGFIKNSHNPDGNTIYGVGLSVLPSYQKLGIGSILLETIAKIAIKNNIKQAMLGGRIAEYYKYADKMSPEEYIRQSVKTEKGVKPLDPEIYFYQRAGLRIVKLIPNYFKDSESLDYGVLLLWNNPFYNKWYRWIGAKIFKI